MTTVEYIVIGCLALAVILYMAWPSVWPLNALFSATSTRAGTDSPKKRSRTDAVLLLESLEDYLIESGNAHGLELTKEIGRTLWESTDEKK